MTFKRIAGMAVRVIEIIALVVAHAQSLHVATRRQIALDGVGHDLLQAQTIKSILQGCTSRFRVDSGTGSTNRTILGDDVLDPVAGIEAASGIPDQGPPGASRRERIIASPVP